MVLPGSLQVTGGERPSHQGTNFWDKLLLLCQRGFPSRGAMVAGGGTAISLTEGRRRLSRTAVVLGHRIPCQGVAYAGEGALASSLFNPGIPSHVKGGWAATDPAPS